VSYIVTGRWERHKRQFEVTADFWAEAEYIAPTFIDGAYSKCSGKTYGQSVWQFGAISIREVGGDRAVIRKPFADQILKHLGELATGD